ncbi:MAG: hypothetical protein HYV03_00965 [Deltaproteobacteria bacterium]|nr:hypothetical protein [Deltaproteobacteria bacterium]
MTTLAVRAIPVTDLRSDIDGALEGLGRRQLLKILKRGEPIGVLLRPETYERLEAEHRALEDRLEGLAETLAILQDKKMLRMIKKSLRELQRGKARPWEEVFGEPL